MIRALLAVVLLSFLSACSGMAPSSVPFGSRPDMPSYTAEDGPTLTLLSMINNRDGSGGHTGLMVSASERVIFDPAGSFRNEKIPETDDVIYAVDDVILLSYKASHARSSHHVVLQEIAVSAEVAEMALNLVRSNGPVSPAGCARSTSAILRQLPGFDWVSPTLFPRKLMDQFATIQGVATDKYYEDDAGDVSESMADAIADL